MRDTQSILSPCRRTVWTDKQRAPRIAELTRATLVHKIDCIRAKSQWDSELPPSGSQGKIWNTWQGHASPHCQHAYHPHTHTQAHTHTSKCISIQFVQETHKCHECVRVHVCAFYASRTHRGRRRNTTLMFASLLSGRKNTDQNVFGFFSRIIFLVFSPSSFSPSPFATIRSQDHIHIQIHTYTVHTVYTYNCYALHGLE